MKIMILGAAGMLGGHLTRALKPRHQALPRTRDDWDITDARACSADVASNRPDVVVNCAAFTKVDDCEREPDKAMLVNGETLRWISEACRTSGSRLIQVSTDYIFDGTKGSPYREEDVPNPLNVYGRSKLKGEEYARRQPGSLIVRTSWLYGRGGPNFVDTIARLAQTGNPLKIVNDQFGSPTYAADLASALLLLVEKGTTGIVHVTNSGVCSWYEFAGEVLKVSGLEEVPLVPISTGELSRPAQRPLFSALDGSRYVSVAGGALRPWQEALKDYLASRPPQAA